MRYLVLFILFMLAGVFISTLSITISKLEKDWYKHIKENKNDNID